MPNLKVKSLKTSNSTTHLDFPKNQWYCLLSPPPTSVSYSLFHQRNKDLPNPEPRANFFSRLLFVWINSFIMKGYKKPVTDDDVWIIPDQDRCHNLEAELEANWEIELSKKRYFFSFPLCYLLFFFYLPSIPFLINFVF